jgi:hypothetical protein
MTVQSAIIVTEDMQGARAATSDNQSCFHVMAAVVIRMKDSKSPAPEHFLISVVVLFPLCPLS